MSMQLSTSAMRKMGKKPACKYTDKVTGIVHTASRLSKDGNILSGLEAIAQSGEVKVKYPGDEDGLGKMTETDKVSGKVSICNIALSRNLSDAEIARLLGEQPEQTGATVQPVATVEQPVKAKDNGKTTVPVR